MIKATVKLFATLQIGRFAIKEDQFEAGVTVEAIMERYGLSKNQVLLILINGRHAGYETVISEGDTVALFPPIGGG
ncbi:MAG: MoaD/ThiS family protein [Syntrophorhabdaceae bacterium]